MLPSSRRRWSLCWRVQGELAADKLHAAAVVSLQVSLTVIGSSVDGSQVIGARQLSFAGPARNCDDNIMDGRRVALANDDALVGMLREELERVDELLDIEPDCKWAMLAQGRLKEAVAE